MADTKISALTGATTPLAGTEVVPLVQSSTTKNVSVANLTAGRSVSANDVTLSGGTANGVLYLDGSKVATSGTALVFDGTNLGIGGTPAEKLQVTGRSRIVNIYLGETASNYDIIQSISSAGLRLISVGGSVYLDSSANLKVDTGNLVIGTSGKGIDFTANTPAAGMTSQLLNWYEEGTWTPTPTNISGTNTYSGTYTRIGNRVNWEIIINTSTTIVITAASSTLSLPFASGVDNTCVAANRSTGSGYGTGLVTGSSTYPPTCNPGASQSIVVSGSYRV